MSRSKKTFIIISSSAVFLIALIIVVAVFLNGSSQGEISNNQAPVSNSPVSSFNMTPVKVSGTYISFNYPKSLTESSNNGGAAILESYLYKYKDTPESWQLSVDVNKLSQPSLDYDSNYSVRKLNPSVYKESNAYLDSKNFIVMTDTTATGFSEVAFILNGNMSADISLQGNDINGIDNLQSTFNMVLSSFEWK